MREKKVRKRRKRRWRRLTRVTSYYGKGGESSTAAEWKNSNCPNTFTHRYIVVGGERAREKVGEGEE